MRIFRILALLLCLTMVLAAVGCTEGETASSAETASVSSATQSATESAAESETESAADSATADLSSAVETPASSQEELSPYANRTVDLVDAAGKWRITGRTMQVIDDNGREAMSYDHAAQGFFFNADCEGDVSVNISIKFVSKTLGEYRTDFLVCVDGKETYVTVKSAAAEDACVIPVASGLSRGKHTFEIYRCSEYLKALGALTSITLNGTLLSYEAPTKALKMAFIGDSVTSGSGMYALNGKEDDATRDPSDATHSYAFLCAKELNADFTVASRSGSYSIKDGSKDSIYYTYDYVTRDRSNTLYSNNKEAVDIFVISLGTNDCDTKRGFSNQQIHDSIQALITRVRTDHPSAKIVWTYGQLNKTRLSVVKGAVEEKMANDANRFFYEFTQEDSSGGWSHPSAQAQARDGKELAEFIRTTVQK